MPRVLAVHLGTRYLLRRRAAWLALAAITLTVAVPVVVLGVTQGFLEVTRRQARANEADITATSPVAGDGLRDGPAQRELLTRIDGVAGVAPFVQSWAIMTRQRVGGDLRANLPCEVSGSDWAADWAIGRLSAPVLHPPPVVDLSAPNLPPEQRGTGFLTSTVRAQTALAALPVAAALGGLPLPLPPQARPRPGVICGRELLYPHGMRPGEEIQLAVPNGSGGTVGKVAAEISDTLGTGVMEVDRFTVLAPLPLAQRLAGMQARDGRTARVSGFRVKAEPGRELRPLARAVSQVSGLHALTWMEVRGNVVRGLEVQRNVLVLVMICIQAITVFIVYAVFSTLVIERRHDIGVLMGLGARRRQIAAAFLWAGLAACLAGGVLGWLLGWGALAALNPISRWTGIPLFPQDVIYTPEAPTSFDPWIPLFFAAVMTGIGLLAVALPAWRASRVDPIETLREGA